MPTSAKQAFKFERVFDGASASGIDVQEEHRSRSQSKSKSQPPGWDAITTSGYRRTNEALSFSPRPFPFSLGHRQALQTLFAVPRLV